MVKILECKKKGHLVQHLGCLFVFGLISQSSIFQPSCLNGAMASLDPVVQSIVSLTISLRHKFVKQISAKVTNTLLFFVEKM